MSKQNLKVMKYLTVLFAAAMIMFSCTAARTRSTNNAPVNVKEIVKDPETTLVDVRIPEQFAEKTAANAVNIPLATIKDNLSFFKEKKILWSSATAENRLPSPRIY